MAGTSTHTANSNNSPSNRDLRGRKLCRATSASAGGPKGTTRKLGCKNSSPRLGEVARRADGVCKAEGACHSKENMYNSIKSYSSGAKRHLPYLRGGITTQGNSPSKLEGVTRRVGGVCAHNNNTLLSRQGDSSPNLGEQLQTEGVCHLQENMYNNITSYSSGAKRHLPYLRGGVHSSQDINQNATYIYYI